MQLTYPDEVKVRFDPPYAPSTENISPEDRAAYGPPDTVSHLTVMDGTPFEVLKTPSGQYSISLAVGADYFQDCDGEATRDGAFVGLAPEDIAALFPQIKYQLENRKSIRTALIQQYEAATSTKAIINRSPTMSWNFGAGITCTARVDMTGMNMYDAYLVWIEHTIEATGQDKFLQSVKNYGVDYVVNSLLTTFFNQWRPVGSGFSGGVTEEQIIELIRSRVEEFAASIPKPPVGSKTTSAMHRRPNMAWNFDTNKSAAMATLQRLATKGTDPLDDDIKAIADRAAQDAATVVSNLANERALADMYHKSDKSKGLDKGSEFYNTIQKYSEENFKRSKPQLDAILQKYQEKDELAYMVGAYRKAFEDHFYEQVTKAWQELRPSQTINPLPGDQAPAFPAAPEMAPAVARRLL